jgi:hypothetical protein
MFAPPKFFIDLLPDGAQDRAAYIWYGVLVVILLIVLRILLIMRHLLGGKKKESAAGPGNEERLGEYPPARASSGDRRLMVEGIPVRLRLVIVAPAGTDAELDEDAVDKLLERLLPGLGEIYREDRPRVRIWPTQISAEGFTNQFHRNTVIPEGKGEQSPWVCVAGRVKLGNDRVMLGMALQGARPNTIGRRTLEPDEWASVLRVRVRSEA